MLTDEKIIKTCPFCGVKNEIPTYVSASFFCSCGAYGQTDLISDAYLFSLEACDAFEIADTNDPNFDPSAFIEIKNGGIVMEGNDDDPEPIVLFWAKRKD